MKLELLAFIPSAVFLLCALLCWFLGWTQSRNLDDSLRDIGASILYLVAIAAAALAFISALLTWVIL